MKQNYKLLLIVIGFFLSFNTSFSQGFVAKEDVNIDRLRSSNVWKRTVKFSDLFTYPSEIDLNNNITINEDVTISFTSSNESSLFFDGYYHTAYGGAFFYYNVPSNAYGNEILTITIEYNGVINSAQLIVNTQPIKCVDDAFSLDIGDSVEVVVTKNDAPSAYFDYSTFEIVDYPTHGSIEIIDNGKIKYVSNKNTANYSVDRFTYKIADLDGNYGNAAVDIDIHKNPYASKVFDFLPAPGQFVNTNMANAKAAENVLGNTSAGVSLGGFGGYIVVGFDQPIANRPENPYGVDFTVAGNAFSGWGEPAAVMVMKDENGNGIPDDTWYELAGSEYYFNSSIKNLTMTYYNPKYDTRYTIPFSTDKDFNGAMRTNSFHQQPYYPDPIDFGISADSASYTGTLTNFLLDKSRPGFITAKRLPLFGYADSRQKNPTPTKPRNPYFDDENGKAADGFDLSWAVDSEGNHVELDEVHFIKIYNTTQEDGGWLGEVSPEIFSIAMTTPDPNYVPQDYEANAIGVTQLQVLKGESMQYEGILFKNGIPQNGVPNWSSSNTEVATIDNNGLLTAVETGDTELTFSAKEGVTPDAIEISIVELTQVVIELEGNTGGTNDTLKIIKGETGYIHAEAIDNRPAPGNRYVYETYQWTSSDTNVGTINNGLFQAKDIGVTTIAARSTHNSNLFDEIIVKVSEAPEINLKNDTVKIAYDKRQGDLSISDLFVNSSKATMYFKEAKDTEFIQASIKDAKTIEYKILANKFGITEVDFEIEMYNQTQTVTVLFNIENPTYEKNVLFINGGQFMDLNHPTQLKSYLPASETTKTIAENINDATSVQDMVVEGNFAFVSSDYSVTRYDIAKEEATNSVYTQDLSSTEADGEGTEGAGVNNKMVLYKNMLLVTRQFSSADPEDGYNVRVYNKGDLSFIKKIAVSDQATDIVVIEDKAYVMINGGFMGAKSSLAIIDLKTLTLIKELNLGDNGLGVMQMQEKGTDIYFVRLPDFMGRFDSGVLIYNTLNENIAEYGYTADTSYDSSPLSIEPMKGDTLFVKKELGYIAFNTATKTFGTEIHFPIPKSLIQASEYGAKGSAYDPEDKRYYIAYNYWHGNNGKGQIYDSNLDSIGHFEGVEASPELLKISNIYHNNQAPNAGSVVELFFKDADNINTTLPINLFSDPEDDRVDFYVYNPAMLPEGLSYNDDTRELSGNISITNGASETYEIAMQGIDRFGDFALTTVKLTISEDQSPVVVNPISDIVVFENSDDIVVPLEDVFTDSDDEDSAIIKRIKSNSNASLISANIEGENLTLTFSANSFGEAEIEIEAESNGKTVSISFNVNVVKSTLLVAHPIDDVTVGMNASDYVIDLTSVFTDINNDHIIKSVESVSNDGLLTATIVDNNLTLSFKNNKVGVAEIIITAESDGQTVSDKFTVTVSPVTEINEVTETWVSIYPNPSNGIFKIKNDISETTEVRIYNLQGVLVYVSTNYANSTEINLSNQPSGQYIIHLNQDGSFITKKIVIQ